MDRLKEQFDIIDVIGQGTFSTVYKVKLKTFDEGVSPQGHVLNDQCDSSGFFALKHLTPIVRPDRCLKEANILRQHGGKENVAKLYSTLRFDKRVFLLMEFIDSTPFTEWFDDTDWNEVREYMKNILQALAHIHRCGIVHRDLKPSNFLYDRKRKRYRLIDFGLSDCLSSSNANSCVRDSGCSNNSSVSAVNSDDNNSQHEDALNLNPSDCAEPKLLFAVPRPVSSTQIDVHKRKRTSSQSRDEHALNDSTNGAQPKKPCWIRLDEKLKATTLLHRGSQLSRLRTCACTGRLQLCNVCFKKRQPQFSRSGTNGFRAPEVLLRLSDSTTAVDVWAAGVILLSFLSWKHPFFRPKDDIEALAEYIQLFGLGSIKALAARHGLTFLCSCDFREKDLKQCCESSRQRILADEAALKEKSSSGNNASLANASAENVALLFPEDAYILLKELLVCLTPERPRAGDVLSLALFQSENLL